MVWSGARCALRVSEGVKRLLSDVSQLMLSAPSGMTGSLGMGGLECYWEGGDGHVVGAI
jgi:hypothetical protein